MSGDDKDLHSQHPEHENAADAPDATNGSESSEAGDLDSGETESGQPAATNAPVGDDQATPGDSGESKAQADDTLKPDTEADTPAADAEDAADDSKQQASSDNNDADDSDQKDRAPDQEESPESQADQDDEDDEASQAIASMGDSGAPPPPPQTPGDAPPSMPGGDDDPSLHDDEEDEDEEEEDDQEQMSFLDHLSELRVRLTRIAIAVGVGFLACYGFSKQLFEFLMRPLVEVFPPDSTLIFTALPEAFFTYIKVAVVAGVLLTSPYIFYQIWCFVAPGLYEDERKYLIPIALFSGLFFAAGASFGYSVVFPFAFDFFMDFATETIRPMPSLKEYLSFSLKLLFAFGIIFELPLFIFFLARLGIVNATMLRKFRKYAFLCSFLLSAVLTPPDVVSQTLMAGPLIILYELSIWIAYFFGKKPKEPAAEEDEDDADEEDLPAKSSDA